MSKSHVSKKKLRLAKRSLRTLSDEQIAGVDGGVGGVTWTVPQKPPVLGTGLGQTGATNGPSAGGVCASTKLTVTRQGG